jgi:lipid-A-disaccharide synthase
VQILISAGEASGEMYGAQLIEALRHAVAHVGTAAPGCPTERSAAEFPPTTVADLRSAGQPSAAVPTRALEFFGVGGERMRAAGCDTIVDAKDLSVVGITEILSHLPKIWGLFHRLIAEADRRRPDLAIVIDSPAFNWRVAREMHKRGIPVVYYVCPQFWAWRQGRMRLLRKYVDKALVIFPFEEKFYRDRGVDAEFVGHPLAQLPRPEISREQYAAQNCVVASRPWVTLMPGSREKEVRMNLPTIVESAAKLGSEYEYLLPVAPTLSHRWLESLVSGSVSVHLVPAALPALAHSRAAVIASGTATVEAAMMGTPFVMVYRVSPLTYFLGRSRVKVPHFAMVNLIAGREVVPELVQNNFTADRVVEKLQNILRDGPTRTQMLDDLAMVRNQLGKGDHGRVHAADVAAGIILRLIRSKA